MTQRIIYSDLNATVYLYGGDEVLYNIDAVAGHIANIFFTRNNEVDFEPTFGAGFLENLFDLPADYSEWEIITSLRSAFNKWAPEVILNPNKSKVQSLPDQALRVVSLCISIAELNLDNITIQLEVSFNG